MFTVLFWKKAWTWTKHHWYWPVIIVLFLFSAIAGSASRDKLFGLLSKQKENYEKELQVIKKATEEKDKKKTELFKGHLEEVAKIEREHDVQLRSLKLEKQKELAEIIKKNKNSPDDLAMEVAKMLSATYHEKNR